MVQNPPMPPLTTQELDRVYAAVPAAWHPDYDKDGGVPGIEEVKFSVTHCRGCFGACNFCSIAFHQGRVVTARSEDSVIGEVEKLTKLPGFKGYIHDIGGPTANFRHAACDKQLQGREPVAGGKCLFPKPCPEFGSPTTRTTFSLLREIRASAVKGSEACFRALRPAL